MRERKKRSPVWHCDSDELKDVVKHSDTLRKILEYFDIPAKGGNYKTLKTRLLKEKIDFSHIPLGNNSNLGKKFKKEKIPLEQLLIENSNHSRGTLKKRLIEDNLIEYKCSECGLIDEWNDKPIVLQLEHKNGVYNDNRLENLCFLCPNCHSQTNTFAGKSLKKRYQCLCGNEIRKESQACTACFNKSQRKVIRPEKNQLLLDIENLGYLGTGKKYGVSDNAIRKWLKQ